MALLQATKLTRQFGGLKAVSDFTFHLDSGELVGLIGPNGAGKTTVFNMLTGLFPPSSGEILFDASTIHGLKPYEITQRGIARTFQNIRLFNDLTVLDNVRIANHLRSGYGIPAALLRTGSYAREEEQIKKSARSLLEIFHLEGYADEVSKNLPYGQQRRLEIARALATQPKLLLLDEPAAGMNPQETNDLMKLIRWVREKFNLTILLIEHDMSLVMGICERIYVLDYGQEIARGTPDEIRRNPKVIQAYLGEEVAANA